MRSVYRPIVRSYLDISKVPAIDNTNLLAGLHFIMRSISLLFGVRIWEKRYSDSPLESVKFLLKPSLGKCTVLCTGGGPGSSVGIATELRAGRFGIEFRWGRDFPPVQSGPGAGNGSFPGVKCGRGVLPTTHPLLVPRSWKSRAIPLPTLWVTPSFTLRTGDVTFFIRITDILCLRIART